MGTILARPLVLSKSSHTVITSIHYRIFLKKIPADLSIKRELLHF